MGGPAGSLSSRQHSSRGHRGTQALTPRQGKMKASYNFHNSERSLLFQQTSLWYFFGTRTFQRQMSNVLEGLDGVLCHMDDILVYSGDQPTHDQRLVIPFLREAK